MYKRILEKTLLRYSKNFKVVLVTGPRQSGKTTLVRGIFPKKPYVLFENLDKKDAATNDPRKFLEQYPDGAVFDEIQECPELLSYLQGIVDESPQKGKYIITGSQNLLLLNKVKQSLAGRMGILELYPLNIKELGVRARRHSLDRLMFKGMYPELWITKKNPAEFYHNYVRTYLERDVRSVLNVRNLTTFRNFLKMCAGRIGQLVNLTSISNDLGVSRTVLMDWYSVLEASHVIITLPAYYENINKRMIKAPKMYFTDTGVVCHLLGITDPKDLPTHHSYGAIFENFIICEFLKHRMTKGLDHSLYFFRDKTGHEVDLIFEDSLKLNAVELKAGTTFNYDWVKGLEYLRHLNNAKIKTFNLVYGGKDNFQTRNTHVWSYDKVENLYKMIAV